MNDKLILKGNMLMEEAIEKSQNYFDLKLKNKTQGKIFVLTTENCFKIANNLYRGNDLIITLINKNGHWDISECKFKWDSRNIKNVFVVKDIEAIVY